MAIEDIEVAIATAIQEDAGVKALGLAFSTGRMNKTNVFPYVEMTAPLDTRTARTSESLYYWKQVQLKTYAQDRQTAAQAADAVFAVLNDDDLNLNQFVAGIHVLDVQRGNVFYLQEEDAVWCYTILFNIKYRDDRKRLPLV